MMFHIGDKYVLAGIECTVVFVSASGKAYLVPEVDGDEYNNQSTLAGCVFAIIDRKLQDKLGNRAVAITNTECGAV